MIKQTPLTSTQAPQVIPSILKSALSLKAGADPDEMSFSASFICFEFVEKDALDVPEESRPNTAESGVFNASGSGMMTLYRVKLMSGVWNRWYKRKDC